MDLFNFSYLSNLTFNISTDQVVMSSSNKCYTVKFYSIIPLYLLLVKNQ